VPTVENQPVVARLSRSAIFIIATLNGDGDSLRAVRSLCGDLAALVRAVGFRDLNGGLSCVMGFGSEAWDRLFGAPPPRGERHRTRIPPCLVRQKGYILLLLGLL
jgi:porphyrinogen peroxidase